MNFRVFEMLAALVAVVIVARRPDLIAAALRGLVVSSCAMAFGLLPHLASAGENRLGIVILEGRLMGNPIQLGLPLALALVALVTDGGQWLGLRRRPFARLLVLVPVVALLALTTSRAAWLVAFAGLVCGLLFSRRSRATALASALAGLVMFQVIRWSPAGDVLDAAVERTFSSERSTRSRTSGRSDQWIVAWHAATETAGSLLWGYGPGSGAQVYAKKSREVASVEFEVGHEMSLHSLFMQVGVETGLIGLVSLVVWCGAGAIRVAAWTRRSRLILPLACFVGFILIAATVSGTDTVSGMFLGLGLFATARESGAAKADRPRRRHPACHKSHPHREEKSIVLSLTNRTVLAISPHIDDVELGAGGTLHALAERNTVHYVGLSVPPDVERDVFLAEFHESARILGLDTARTILRDFDPRNLFDARIDILQLFFDLNTQLASRRGPDPEQQRPTPVA